MGLTKRQQNRLNRRKQKNQRNTIKRRNVRGKSRVKRKTRKGGAALFEDQAHQGSPPKLGDPVGLKSLQPDQLHQGDVRLESLQPDQLHQGDVRLEPFPQQQPVTGNIFKRYTGPSRKRARASEKSDFGPLTISQTFIPYYDVLDVIDSLCIFVDDMMSELNDKQQRGMKRKENVNRLIELYMTSPEDIALDIAQHIDTPVKSIRSILSTMIKRIITKDSRALGTPILTDPETVAIMSLIGVAIKEKLKTIPVIELGDQNGLKNVFDLKIDPEHHDSIWSSVALGGSGRVPEGLIIDVGNTKFFIKEFIGRRFIYSTIYDDIIQAKQSIYKLIPPRVYAAANIDTIVTDTGELAMEVIRNLQQNFDNLENSLFSVVFNPRLVFQNIGNNIVQMFLRNEKRLTKEMKEHAQCTIFTRIARTTRKLCADLIPAETYDPETKIQSTIVQDNLKDRFHGLSDLEKLELLEQLKKFCDSRPRNEVIRREVQQAKERNVRRLPGTRLDLPGTISQPSNMQQKPSLKRESKRRSISQEGIPLNPDDVVLPKPTVFKSKPPLRNAGPFKLPYTGFSADNHEPLNFEL